MGRTFVFGCVLVFFVFPAKSGTTNNHRNGSSDISYLSLFSRDSTALKSFETISHGLKKMCLKFLIFGLILI